jgi:Mn-dependent DtxR family transcriptional regulator
VCYTLNIARRKGAKQVKESGEMYLESIYVLGKENMPVRSIDIAEHMGYSKPSVCRAVALLKKEGFISVDKDGHITLTDNGKVRAKQIYERHTILTQMLNILGVDKETSSKDACRIEHVISQNTFDAIKKYLQEHK